MVADATAFSRGEIEEFLIHEAALLDEWRLEEWLALMAPDARYLVPPLDAFDADHRETLFLVAGDRRTLASRIRQLLSGTPWAENPRSRTRRLITNVRLFATDGDEARVTANFAVWRFQHEQSDVYVGRYLHCRAATRLKSPEDEQSDVYVGRYLHTLVRGASGLLFASAVPPAENASGRTH